MKILLISALLLFAGFVLGFFYCVGQINKKWDEFFIDTEWEKEFEEQEWP